MWKRTRVIKLGSIADQVRGYAVGQIVFTVMNSRAANATVLFATIPKHLCEALARQYRNGGAPARFPSACVKSAVVTGEGEITMLEKVTSAAGTAEA